MQSEDKTNNIMAVKRNHVEVYNLFVNLKDLQGAESLLDEIFNVMSSYDMAQVLEDVADNWDIEVNEDGTIELN